MIQKVGHLTFAEVFQLVAENESSGLSLAQPSAYHCERTKTGIAYVIFDAPASQPQSEPVKEQPRAE